MLFLLGITAVSAQDVRYYKLTKKKENGTISTNVLGGQFITFRGDVCYESNKNGVGVDHGTMQPCNATITIALLNTWFININQVRDVIGVKMQRLSSHQIKAN